MTEKLVLDACCGSRMMWFDKNNPMAVFMDIRSENHTLCDGRSLEINPDVIADFKNIPFPDKTFKLVTFDPPHFDKLGSTSWMAKKYGKLHKGWEGDIKSGFDECYRVLDDYGVLVFKWNTTQIKINYLLDVICMQPLFGHTTGKHQSTIWMLFIKTP